MRFGSQKEEGRDDDDGDIIVASGGADGIVRIWIVDSENIRLKMLCRLDNGVAPISCVSLKYYLFIFAFLSFAEVSLDRAMKGRFACGKAHNSKLEEI